MKGIQTMKALAAVTLGCAFPMYAQIGRLTDWWSFGGDAQRSGWEKNEARFIKGDVKNFQLLWKMQLDNKQAGPRSLLPPVIRGNIIGYRGFKELAFVAGTSDNLWVIDADLGRMYWQKHFDTEQPPAGTSLATCPGLTATPTLPAPVTFRFASPRAPSAPAGAAAEGGRNPDGSPRPAGANPSPAGVPGPSAAPDPAVSRFMSLVAPKPVYVLSSDGKLRRLNEQNGSETAPPLSFVPPGARAGSLNVTDRFIYTTTSQGCNDAPNAVWSLDLNDRSAKPVSFLSNGSSFQGLGGPVLGSDGTVYVQTGDGPFDPAANSYANTLLALAPGDLKLKAYFALPDAGSSKADWDTNVTTPVVFAYKGRDLIVTTGKDGRLYLLDSNSLGGNDHKTALFRTPPISAGGGNASERGVWGSLSSWEDPSGTRYVLAAVWGPLHAELEAPIRHDETPHGAVVAFKLQEQEGKLSLMPAWVSRDLSFPAPPVIAQGVVFALSNGEFTRKIGQSGGHTAVEEHPEGGTHATLYAFDGMTGNEMYSTGDQVTAPGSLTGLSVANSRLYFTTTDDTLYVFGKYLEH